MSLVLGDSIATGREMQDLEAVLGTPGDSEAEDDDASGAEANLEAAVPDDSQATAAPPASPTTELQKSGRRAALLSKLKSNTKKRLRDGVEEAERRQRQKATEAIVGMQMSLKLLVEVMAASKGLSHMVHDDVDKSGEDQ